MSATLANLRHMSGLRERKRERTRQAIADAALDLFARQGFHETTIPQIAEAADVSPRTVSGYFPAKEDLAFPDADERIGALEERLRSRAPGETAADALRAWLPDIVGADTDRAAELRTRRRGDRRRRRAVRVRAPLPRSRAGRAASRRSPSTSASGPASSSRGWRPPRP